MQPVRFKFTFFALAVALCAGGCGGIAGTNAAPLDAPQAAEHSQKQDFEACKVSSKRVDTSYAAPPPFRLQVLGSDILWLERSRQSLMSHNDYRVLPQGFATLTGKGTLTDDKKRFPAIVRSYQGAHSGVVVTYFPDGKPFHADSYGVKPAEGSLPSAGKATYQGTAFDHDEQGSFTYHVDFATKKGYGEVSGLSRYGTIKLQEGDIEIDRNYSAGLSVYVGSGQAVAGKGQQFRYQLALSGRHGEEITGYPDDAQVAIGLHGARGAVSE